MQLILNKLKNRPKYNNNYTMNFPPSGVLKNGLANPAYILQK